jgi:hypothetical protein
MLAGLMLLTALPVTAASEVKEDSQTKPDITQHLPLQRRKNSDWLYHAMAANYVVLNALDLVTTYKSIERGGREVNPIARTFLANKPAAIAFKTTLTGGVLFALTRVKHHDKKTAYVTLGVLNLVYGLVVTNNIGVYLKLRN